MANLEPASAPQVLGQHPAEALNATSQASHRAGADVNERRSALGEWLAEARVQLQKLPNDLTDDIEDPVASANARHQAEAAVTRRITELESSVQLDVSDPELIGWAHVRGTAAASGQTDDPDSEVVAMKHVTKLLNFEGWGVADVHAERLGYDLKATRGPKVRVVEVKGVKGSASSQGISLTGAELATAGIHGSDYWLYVVDQCSDAKGTLFAAWADPAAVFADAIKDVALLRITGSDLKAAKEVAV
jgi:hypothetical protein